jgi:hypothetical protein
LHRLVLFKVAQLAVRFVQVVDLAFCQSPFQFECFNPVHQKDTLDGFRWVGFLAVHHLTVNVHFFHSSIAHVDKIDVVFCFLSQGRFELIDLARQ